MILSAFGSFLFHEYGHWLGGTLLGNEMVLTLNSAYPQNGYYLAEWHALYSLSGGPAFTLLQALIFWLVIEKFREFSAYPFLFFPFFSRIFSLLFGGFHKQDEAKISLLLNAGTYTVAVMVCMLLLFMVCRGSRLLKLNLQQNAGFFTMATIAELLVIRTSEFLAP